ncbi:hypothetical protein FQA47_010483 [Oryzias melastigma]|uniref:Uncharacterized protein n=1 Tax=Oryzias melastigma TaxID=30732 RepID=A0A834BT58_ORYME|nr:hypothetical protein FQA47_010483 [Oryzias melastigma]
MNRCSCRLDVSSSSSIFAFFNSRHPHQVLLKFIQTDEVLHFIDGHLRESTLIIRHPKAAMGQQLVEMEKSLL